MKNKILLLIFVFFLSISHSFAQLPELLEPVPNRPIELLPPSPKVKWNTIENGGGNSHSLDNSKNNSTTNSSSVDVPDIDNNFNEVTQNSLNDYKKQPASQDAKLQSLEFNVEKTNALRFLNSPCLATLGFDPRRDPQVQERMYRECEDAKRREEMEKNIKIGLGVLLVFGFGGAIVYTFNKGQKK